MTGKTFRASLLLAVAAQFIAGCAMTRSNPVQDYADTMVGKPIQVAVQAFGMPTTNLPACGGCTDGVYAWDQSRVVKNAMLADVQVGTQSNEVMVGMDRGIPIYQTQETPIYQKVPVDRLDYLCDIMATTDARDRIKSVMVTGCTENSHY